MRHNIALARHLSVRALTAFAVALAFIIGSAMPSLAVGGLTGNLTVTVVNSTTKEPISGATVVAVSPAARYTGRTDTHGYVQINGLTVDTYSVSITSPGFDTLTISGVTVQGDNTVDLQTQTLVKTLQQIGRTAARSQASVFQPSQTTDAVTVSGTRVTEALGKTAAISETALALSVPGVQLTNAGRLTIRGGLANEVGYQLDGVNFTEPFLNTNASTNRINGLGSLQVVAGAGDASQGNVGGGVVNVVIKRGSRPAFGFIDGELAAPNYSHQFAMEYGWATPNGRLSNYSAYNGQRYNSYTGDPAHGIDAAQLGSLFGAVNGKNDDIVNNTVYRFGRDNAQSVQVLYQNRNLQLYGANPIGNPYYSYYPYNVYSQRGIVNPLSGATYASYAPAGAYGYGTAAALYADRLYLLPGTPATNVTPYQPELQSFNPTRFLKFEYNNSLNASTFFALRTYNWEVQNGASNLLSAPSRPTYQTVGGGRTGISGELTKTFSEKHTAQIGFLVEQGHPYWNGIEPYSGFNSTLIYEGDAGMANIQDFINPANVSAPISAANPCPIGVTPLMPAGDPNGCYLYRTGQFNGTGVPRVPAFGINYNGTDLQQFAGFVQDTFTPNRFLKAQIGLREDIGNFKQGKNPFNPTDLANPDDVDPSTVSGFFIHPHFLEPRGSLTYTNRNTAVRLGYGRSVEFPEAQTFGTPSSAYGIDPRFFAAPAKGNTASPATWNCGSGYNPTWLPAGGDPVTSANGAAAGSPYANGGTGGLFRCTTYGQQLYWLYDQFNDAPDLGGNKPTWQSNTDMTVQHLFSNGYGVRLTGYYRHGFDVPNTILLKVINDPVTGQPVTQVFGVANVGVTKTSGAELGITTPQRLYGLSAYLSATYTNAISTVPPLIAGEDTLPLVSSASVALGNMYRSGFISPFVVNAGAQYKFRNGFRINPVLNYDKGYPIGVGNLTATGGRLGGTINGVPYNIPQTNLSTAQPAQVAANGAAGSVAATNYVDPVNPGNFFRPYINASRGTPETSAAGGYLSRPRLTADTSFEYQKHRNTFGVQLTNLFGNIYNEPTLNPYWQPVATGVGGPNTGKNSAGFPTNNAYIYGGFRNYGPIRYGNQPYVEYPNGAPTGVRFYYQYAL